MNEYISCMPVVKQTFDLSINPASLKKSALWQWLISHSYFKLHEGKTTSQQGCNWHPLLNMINRDGNTSVTLYREALRERQSSVLDRFHTSTCCHEWTEIVGLHLKVHLLSTPRHSCSHQCSLVTRNSPPTVMSLFYQQHSQKKISIMVCYSSGTCPKGSQDKSEVEVPLGY